MIGDCGGRWWGEDDGGAKGNGLELLVCVLMLVVGVCVGLNPHITHCTSAPARA